MDQRVHLFGIRHHGPGSARSLERALEALEPSSVLIEGPPEADNVLQYASAASMRPPIAILTYAEHDASLAAFFPFAEFSPEWRAILWAGRNERPVRFIDLPSAHRLAGLEAEREALPATEENEDSDGEPESGDIIEDHPVEDSEPSEDILLRDDPMAMLAQAAGYSDSEAWWNAFVEERAHEQAIFDDIAEAMAALREVPALAEHSDENRIETETRREAYMRLQIRQALKETDGPIAVVTGAWHVPALARPVAISEDKAVLKGLPKVKVQATWVPWTDTRLAAATGYGAGVISPGWYQHLWSELNGRAAEGRLDVTGLCARWQGKVARMLRDEGQITSTASVIEAARLASSLAALRQRTVPGLPEMQDASLAVMCHGDEAPVRLVQDRLVLGTEVGEIDADLPQIPLQADLARQQKKLRLKPEALEQEIALDLRSETGLAKSTLLNRLRLIDIPWGEQLDPGGSRGTFRERWRLVWEPEYSVRLVEALVWGTTVETAAGGTALERCDSTDRIGELAEIVQSCLMADLPGAAEKCIGRLQALAAQSSETGPLMDAVPPLVGLLRYGTARRIPEDALSLLVRTVAAEINAGLVYGCRQLDEASSRAMAGRLDAYDRAMALFEDETLTAGWQQALRRVAIDDQAAPMVRGGAVKRLYDGNVHDSEETGRLMSLALSPSVPPENAGAWLEGFLANAGTVLLIDDRLRGIMDEWLVAIAEDHFTELLPMLRRVTGGFDAMERRRLLSLLGGRQSQPAGSGIAATVDNPAFAEALPLLKIILGVRL